MVLGRRSIECFVNVACTPARRACRERQGSGQTVSSADYPTALDLFRDTDDGRRGHGDDGDGS